MKIITWNVNGLRAALGKGALEWAFTRQPDILCLQEIKARPDQDYFLVSEKLASQVRDVVIHEDVEGSDHCPVELILD